MIRFDSFLKTVPVLGARVVAAPRRELASASVRQSSYMRDVRSRDALTAGGASVREQERRAGDPTETHVDQPGEHVWDFGRIERGPVVVAEVETSCGHFAGEEFSKRCAVVRAIEPGNDQLIEVLELGH